MAYLHGVYSENASASGIAEYSQGTVPVYIGTLPVHRIDTNALASIKHSESDECMMLLLTSYNDVKALNIYSDDWETYSLCEAINAHFVSGKTAPVILICGKGSVNEASVTEDISLVKSGTSYVGYLEDSKATLEDMAVTIPSVTLESGDVSYVYSGDKVKITITKQSLTTTTGTVTYKQANGDKLSVDVFTDALELLDKVENVTYMIPNILCAPQYSGDPQYHDLMVQKAIDKVAGKWNLICLSDITDESVTSIETAISWKNTNNYNHVLDKVFYPKVSHNGKIYHLSTIAAAKMQALDIENGDVPYASVSNKQITAESIIGGDGKIVYMSEFEGNKLNQNGITTALFMKGQIRLWGSHMANYSFLNLAVINAEDRFDVAVRMAVYMNNYLQYNYLDEVDTSITKKDIDSIVNSVQMWLDSLVNSGMLLYATAELDGGSDIANGDIAFNIHVTYPFIAKSITFKVIYTDVGLSVLTSTEEGGNE